MTNHPPQPMLKRTRVIRLTSDTQSPQYINAETDTDYEIGLEENIREAMRFYQEDNDLRIYDAQEQLQAVIYDYYIAHSSPPAVVYIPAANTVTDSQDDSEAHVLAGSSADFEFVHTLLGVTVVAAGVAAAVGKKGEDHSHSAHTTGQTAHNGVHNADDISAAPYFIQAMNTPYGRTGYLKDNQVWSGQYGTAIRVRYGFANAEEGQQYNGWKPFSDTQKDDIRRALEEYSRYVNIKFSEDNTDADFKFYLDDANNHGGYAGYGSNVHISAKYYDKPNAFFASGKPYGIADGKLFLYTGLSTVLHEIGHSLGLTHPFDQDIRLSQSEDNRNLTVMSYTVRDFIQRVDYTYHGNEYYVKHIPIFPQHLGIFDLATLHYRYGVNPDYHPDDDTYGFSTFDPQQPGGGGIYITDGGGNDTFDASEQHLDVFIDLTPGSWLHAGTKSETLVYDPAGHAQTGQMFISYGSHIENAKGGSGDDVLHGNADNNMLFGNAGDDTLNGGNGADTLSGGSGADTFIFNTALGRNYDIITDFSLSDGDQIQLDSQIFTALTPGTLPAEQWVAGKQAQDANDHILYAQESGMLAYDPDGNGPQNAVVFAHLQNLAELSSSAIVIL